MNSVERLLIGVGAALVLAAGPGAANAQMGGPGTGTPNAGNPRHGATIAAGLCASCHGADGNSANPQYPKLAGQNPAYLYWQLWAFKQGQRPSAVMAGIVAPMSDADLADVSAYYAAQAVSPDQVADKTLASAGEQIYYAGRPSCAMCHQGGGMSMMGMMGGTARNAPQLRGQHALYTLQQLDAFASGARRDGAMNQIAPQLSEAERKAVAAYLAGLH